MILTLLSLCIILTYVGVMVIRLGIPYSISDTYYSLQHKFWFGFSMIATAVLLMPEILSRTPENYQFTAFLMCAGLCFVGVAPNFKEGLDRPVHIVSTTVAAVFSQIWVALTQPWLLLVWIVWILYIGFRIRKKRNGGLYSRFVLCKPLFFIEVIAFVLVYTLILL